MKQNTGVSEDGRGRDAVASAQIGRSSDSGAVEGNRAQAASAHPGRCDVPDQGRLRDGGPAIRTGGSTCKAGPSRVAVPALDEAGLSAFVDSRFGRAPWFMLVDVESGRVVENLINSSAGAAHGAGTGAAALVAQSGVEAVVAGRIKARAWRALQALGVEVLSAPEGLTVGQVVGKLKVGGLPRVPDAPGAGRH